MNERSYSKTDINFELRTVENFWRSIKEKLTLFTCTILFICTILSMLLFTTLFIYTERWRGIDQWCDSDWWGVTILLDKILMHCWSVTWQHVSGQKIVCTVHAYTQDYLQPNCVIIQTASLFKPRDQIVYCSNHMVKSRTVDWWHGAILSVQNIFNPMAMIYSVYL